MSLSFGRIQKELADLQREPIRGFQGLKVDEANITKWNGLLLPDKEPYKSGAFRIEIEFSNKYPFKAPQVKFLTKIYHPNIDEDGKVCLNIINEEKWKPATKIREVIEELLKMVNDPEPEHPLRADVAEEFVKENAKFMKTAQQFTKMHAEKRPH